MEAIVRNVQQGILKNCCEVVLVFANKKTAKGLETAQKMGIATACIESKGKKRTTFDKEVVEMLQAYNLDYIVLAGYMRVLSLVFVKNFPKKIINIHPADTHQFKGLGAYDWAFEQKMDTTKITIHYVDEGVDTGEIIAQKTVDLRGATTLEEVEKRGLQVEHELYSATLKRLLDCKIVKL